MWRVELHIYFIPRKKGWWPILKANYVIFFYVSEELYLHQQIWQPSGQATRLLHLGTTPSGVRKVPVGRRGKKEEMRWRTIWSASEISVSPHLVSLSSRLTCSHWTSTRTLTGDRWNTWFTSWTSPSSPRTWLCISSQRSLSLVHALSLTSMQWTYIVLMVVSWQEKNHVPEDCGPFTHVWEWKEVGGFHVSGNNQERNRHVSKTRMWTQFLFCSFEFLWSSECFWFQGNDDDRMWLVSHHQALGGAEQGERQKNRISKRLFFNIN